MLSSIAAHYFRAAQLFDIPGTHHAASVLPRLRIRIARVRTAAILAAIATKRRSELIKSFGIPSSPIFNDPGVEYEGGRANVHVSHGLYSLRSRHIGYSRRTCSDVQRAVLLVE